MNHLGKIVMHVILVFSFAVAGASRHGGHREVRMGKITEECYVAADYQYVELVGDGKCDQVYNIPQCDFDGGDCCPVSCHLNMVAGALNDCSAPMDCKDPDSFAVDNIVRPDYISKPSISNEIKSVAIKAADEEDAMEKSSKSPSGDHEATDTLGRTGTVTRTTPEAQMGPDEAKIIAAGVVGAVLFVGCLLVILLTRSSAKQVDNAENETAEITTPPPKRRSVGLRAIRNQQHLSPSQLGVHNWTTALARSLSGRREMGSNMEASKDASSDGDAHVSFNEGVAFDVWVPPGTLGLILENNLCNGHPLVHSINESSSIREQVDVGDEIVAVDGEDVRELEAIDVSKLISQKSRQAERRLTLIRPSALA